jgi:hypothetical protein
MHSPNRCRHLDRKGLPRPKAGRDLPGYGEPARKNSKDKIPNSNDVLLDSRTRSDEPDPNYPPIGIWKPLPGIFTPADLSTAVEGTGTFKQTKSL